MAKNKVEEKNKKIDTKVQKVTNTTAKNNKVTENINIKIAKIGRNKTDNYKSTSKITIERHMKLREKVKCNNVESGNSDKNSPKERQRKHRKKLKSNIVEYNEYKHKEKLRQRKYREELKIKIDDQNLRTQYRLKEKLKKRKQRSQKSHTIANKKRGKLMRQVSLYHKNKEIDTLTKKINMLEASNKKLKRQRNKNINSDNDSYENVSETLLGSVSPAGKKGHYGVLS